MKNKNFIIRLIQQDMKHQQLVLGLQKLGLETHLHTLDIMDLVAELMGFARGRAIDEWCEVYMAFCQHTLVYSVTDTGHNLLPLARECYAQLCERLPGKKHK